MRTVGCEVGRASNNTKRRADNNLSMTRRRPIAQCESHGFLHSHMTVPLGLGPARHCAAKMPPVCAKQAHGQGVRRGLAYPQRYAACHHPLPNAQASEADTAHERVPLQG